MATTTVTYKARSGSGMSDERAEMWGHELERIETEYGQVSVNIVVSEARDPDSPLHEEFDWNNNEAGHKWRIHQARKCIRKIVKVERSDEEPRSPQFVSIKQSEETDPEKQEERGYLSRERVLNDKELRHRHVTDLVKWAYGRRDEMAEYDELEELVQALDAFAEEYL